MADSVDLIRQTSFTTRSPLSDNPASSDLVLMAEKIFHKLQQPEQIRSRLADIVELAGDRLDQVIITPNERQAAQLAHGELAHYLHGAAVERARVLASARSLATVLAKAGDLALSRAVHAGVNALLKRQMAH